MTIGYPHGKKMSLKNSIHNHSSRIVNHSGRGMSLEDDINATNAYYLSTNKAVIHKKPTPIQIVNVDYPKRSSAKIKEAYFQQPSTTDYNGVYKGRYLDFEAKETNSPTSFPLHNFHTHQIKHMENVVTQDAIAFVILAFRSKQEVYLISFQAFYFFWERMLLGGRKSITYSELQEKAHLIPYSLNPRLDFLPIIDKFF